MPGCDPSDPGLLSARWGIGGSHPYELLAELLAGQPKDRRRLAFAGGLVVMTTSRNADGSLGFSVTSPGASLCQAKLWLQDGDTLVELTYRRDYGKRLVTTPEGTLLLEVMMGCVLDPAAGFLG